MGAMSLNKMSLSIMAECSVMSVANKPFKLSVVMLIVMAQFQAPFGNIF
jgi:hypothetical protein